MTNVTVIGTGNVGTAVATLVAKGGASVQVVDRDREKAVALADQVGGTVAQVGEPLTGEVVVLAVPYGALAELAATYGDQLDGKVVVDVTNPVDLATFDGLTVDPASSAAAELAELVPGARVLKAFNTTFAGALAAGEIGGGPVTVLVAGDDEAAKQTLIDVVRAGGVQAVDAGSLKRARELEALGFLQITLAAREVVSWVGGFALRS